MRFKTRLTLSFGLFAFLLCVLFAALLAESLTAVEDDIVSSMLRQEADYLLSRYQENPELLVVPDLEQLKGYVSNESNVPEWLESFETGYHQSDDFHVLVQILDGERRLYLVYDETSGMLEQHEVSLLIILGIIILIVSAIGIGLGYYQANVLARPINYLASQIDRVSVEKPEIIPLETNDEIGLLSRAYAGLIGRLDQFIQREKAFTRYASHELKTPLSIINNNIELIQNADASDAVRKRALQRLQDATRQMQQQVDVFLMLAREGQLE